MSKGSNARPFSVSRAQFAATFDAIFKPKSTCCDTNAPVGGCNQGRNCGARKEQAHGADADPIVADKKDVQPARAVAEARAQERAG